MTTFFSGIRPKRYHTPEFINPIPDMILEDGKNRINPEWENAEYEEVFIWKKKPRGKIGYSGKMHWRNDQ